MAGEQGPEHRGVLDTTSAGPSLAVTTITGIYLTSCFSAPSAMISAVFMPLSSSAAAVLAFHHGFEASELWDFENTKFEDLRTLGPLDFGTRSFGVSQRQNTMTSVPTALGS